MEKENSTTRVRGSFSTSAKGIAQLDITAEAPTVQEMENLLREATQSVVKVLKEFNIKQSHEVVETVETKKG